MKCNVDWSLWFVRFETGQPWNVFHCEKHVFIGINNKPRLLFFRELKLCRPGTVFNCMCSESTWTKTQFPSGKINIQSRAFILEKESREPRLLHGCVWIKATKERERYLNQYLFNIGPWMHHGESVIHRPTQNGVELILTWEVLCLISQPIMLQLHDVRAVHCQSLHSVQPQNSEHSVFFSGIFISNSVSCYICGWGDGAGSPYMCTTRLTGFQDYLTPFCK